MNTSRSNAKVLEMKHVWGKTIQEAMDKAYELKMRGWVVEGNPCPMFFRGEYGTGVTIVRIADE